MKITRHRNNTIRVDTMGDGFVESQSAESHILFAILQKLEEIRCGIIDVESSVDNILDHIRKEGGD